jgi:hypothetical protein
VSPITWRWRFHTSRERLEGRVQSNSKAVPVLEAIANQGHAAGLAGREGRFRDDAGARAFATLPRRIM